MNILLIVAVLDCVQRVWDLSATVSSSIAHGPNLICSRQMKGREQPKLPSTNLPIGGITPRHPRNMSIFDGHDSKVTPPTSFQHLRIP
jgi:hypothetical protein